MTNEGKSQNRRFDLEERTSKFGENIIRFCAKVPRNVITNPLITQLVRCGTSVGANYSEADDAESKLDFRHKIGICKKEARESKHFIKMIAVAFPEAQEECKMLWQEVKELNLIFNKIYQKLK